MEKSTAFEGTSNVPLTYKETDGEKDGCRSSPKPNPGITHELRNPQSLSNAENLAPPSLARRDKNGQDGRHDASSGLSRFLVTANGREKGVPAVFYLLESMTATNARCTSPWPAPPSTSSPPGRKASPYPDDEDEDRRVSIRHGRPPRG